VDEDKGPLLSVYSVADEMIKDQFAAPAGLAQFLRVVDFSRQTLDDALTLVEVWCAEPEPETRPA
jgi:hypothetical protein